MNSDALVTVAVWSVLVVPFVCIAAYLWTRGELTPQTVAAYWFPALVLMLVGVVPVPWQAIPG